MSARETYLDWNATAPLRPEAAAAITAALADFGNPSSVHRRGRLARQTVERAREAVAGLVDGPAEGVIFTSGGTEANHLALRGAGRERVLVSAVEHSSTLEAVVGAERIPVDSDGIVSLDALDRLLVGDPRPALVSVMLANNETGVIQPVADIAAIAHAHGALYHCDAVQAAGKMPLKMGEIGADFLSLSAHKLGGPSGVGALIVTGAAEPGPLLRGGGQERGRRAGTENVSGIAGFGAAAAAAAAQVATYERVCALRDHLERFVRENAPVARILGVGVPRLPNTSAIAIPRFAAETQVIALDLEGIMVSAGAACSSGKVQSSHVLAAMGEGPDIAGATVRVSLGWGSTEDDIEHFLAAWTALYHRRFGRPAAARAA